MELPKRISEELEPKAIRFVLDIQSGYQADSVIRFLAHKERMALITTVLNKVDLFQHTLSDGVDPNRCVGN